MLRLSVAFVAIIAIALATWHLVSSMAGLTTVETQLGALPVTVFTPERQEPSAVVILCHGFAGSQQMMLPFATTLARNGYTVVTFDFPGHGRNRAPLAGGVTDYDASGRALTAALETVATFARGLPGTDGRLLLLGHSMGADIAVRHAEAHRDVEATVGVSLFSIGVTTDSPRNLLIVDGALEPGFIRDEGFRLVGLAAGGHAEDRMTYGRFADGTARRIALSPGVEHIGVIYSVDSMAEALAWMNRATGRDGSGFLDRRGPWLALLFGGILALAWPLSHLLPQAVALARVSLLSWPRILLVALVPAVLTPLVLWQIPVSFLELYLGDYISLHFGLFGLLTLAAVRLVRRAEPKPPRPPIDHGRLAVAFVAASVFCVAAIAVPTDRFITSYWPTPERLTALPFLWAGMLLYFGSDEYFTRRAGARRGVHILTKACFLASLLLAVALNPQKMFFLLIVAPAVLLYFVFYGLFATWIHRRCRHPLPGAAAVSLAIAWGMSATFPLIGP
jgi:pimeloyl-ACP methyl ester carboxylesterase